MPFFIIFFVTLFFTIVTLIITRLLAQKHRALPWTPAILALVSGTLLLFNALGVEDEINLYLLFGIALIITAILNGIYIIWGFKHLNIK